MRRLGAGAVVLACLVLLPGATAALPTISVNDATAIEMGAGATFTVRLTEASDADVVVNWTATPGTASATDYAPPSGVVTIPAGQTTETFTVDAVDDPLYEGTETFTVQVSHAEGSDEGAGTITDNESPPTLAISGPATVDEVDGTATYNVTLTGQSATPVTVSFATANGSATSPADYTHTSGTHTWLPGETGPKPIPVTIRHDTLDEPNETFSVNLSGESPGVGVTNRNVTTTILDNDPTPTLALTGPPSVDEAAGTATYSIAITGQSASTVSVQYATAPGTATTPQDYGDTSGSRSWPSGDTTPKTFTVPIANDALDENDENFSVNLSGESNASVSVRSVTTTIVDNDPLPSATINDITVTEGNNATTVNAVFTVTLSAVSGREVSIPWATAPGTATEPEDYQPGSGTVVIAPGATTGTITVVVKGDNLFESNEQYSVVLVNPTNATLADNRGQGTITNDDTAGNPTVGPASVTEGSGGTSDLVFQVSLPGPRPQTTFNYRTVAGSAGSADYTEVGGAQIVFPAKPDAGPTTQQIVIKVAGDTLDENDEAFTLQLLNPTTNAVVASATGTIVDDDRTSKVSINDASADEPTEGTEAMKFTIALSAVSARTVGVQWTTENGTAATGSDYTAASGSVSFAPGETTKEITITVLGDAVDEENETLFVNLTGLSGAEFAPAGNQGLGTIVDKNAPPSLSISDTSARESEGATFTVTLAGTTLKTVTVRFNTSDGTAKAGSDYVARVGTLTFAPGEKTKAIAVTVVDDTVAEIGETFTVTLSDQVNAAITKRTGIASIEASDQAPTTTKTQNTPPPDTKPKPDDKPKTLLPKMLLGPRTVTITATGVARMLVTCNKASPITCAGSVSLETVTKPKFALGKKSFSVKKGKKVYVPIKLSVRGLKRLLLKGTLQVKAIVVVKTTAKDLRVVPGVITLKLKPGTTFKLPAVDVIIDSP